MSIDLCEELIVEILLRLPSKSLIWFRSVSKSLCACISSPGFIRLHALRSPNKVMITHQIRCGETCTKRACTLHSEDQLSYNNPYMDITPVEYPFKLSIIVGSCNEILCVFECAKRNARILLWNPLIRRIVTVYDGPLKSRFLVKGFGFDPIIGDYKILTISDPSSFVYTMNTRTWREVASPTTPFTLVRCRSCLFNGTLHWVVKGYVDHYYIMTFDLSSEVFSMIALPEPSWRTSIVTIIKGSLAVISSKHNDSRIWVRKEYDSTAASWSIAFKLNSNPFEGAQRVVQISPNDKLCILVDKKIIVYNLKTHERSSLVDLSDSLCIIGMNICVESLELFDM